MLFAVALQDVTGDSVLRAKPEFSSKIVKVTPPLKTKPYYLMLSDKFVKNNPDVAQKIWDAIGNIRKESFDSIAGKYSK